MPLKEITVRSLSTKKKKLDRALATFFNLLLHGMLCKISCKRMIFNYVASNCTPLSVHILLVVLNAQGSFLNVYQTTKRVLPLFFRSGPLNGACILANILTLATHYSSHTVLWSCFRLRPSDSGILIFK